MQCKSTKEETFQQIYDTYHNDVYKIGLYYTKDAYIAEDILQKTFFKFYLHMDNINLRPESVRAYLLRTVRNLSYNWIRDSKWQSKCEYLDEVAEEAHPKRSTEDEYLKNEDWKSKRKLIGKIMAELQQENESWYDILHLIYCMGKSHEQAAQELGITLQVLYSKLYRAKRWIRKHFESEYQDL